MSFSAQRLPKLICVGVCFILFTACDSPPANTAGPTVTDGGNNNPPIGIAGEYEVIPERKLSPLDEYMSFVSDRYGWEFLDIEAQERVFWSEVTRRENFIAQCMHKFGFDYIPNLEAWGFTRPAPNDEWRPQERDWVAQYGYAFVSRPSSWPSTAPLIMFGDPGNLGPNEPILAELSESEQEAWWGAFFSGIGDPFNLAGDKGLGFFSDHGRTSDVDEIQDCRIWAGIQLDNENDAIESSDEFRPLMDAVNNLRDSFREDISPSDQAWSQCMDDKGFLGFTRQWEAQFQINTEFNEINTGWESFNTPEMAALQEREINMALADFDCRVATNFAANQQAYILQRETQFVQDNRAALDALRDAAEQGR